MVRRRERGKEKATGSGRKREGGREGERERERGGKERASEPGEREGERERTRERERERVPQFRRLFQFSFPLNAVSLMMSAIAMATILETPSGRHPL